MRLMSVRRAIINRSLARARHERRSPDANRPTLLFCFRALDRSDSRDRSDPINKNGTARRGPYNLCRSRESVLPARSATIRSDRPFLSRSALRTTLFFLENILNYTLAVTTASLTRNCNTVISCDGKHNSLQYASRAKLDHRNSKCEDFVDFETYVTIDVNTYTYLRLFAFSLREAIKRMYISECLLCYMFL